jgi:arsenate reductase
MSEKKRVLFVCVENSCRSQMAEAFAHIHGGDRVDAYSAGSRPSGIVNPKAIAAMREIGYDLATHVSKSLGELPDVEWDFVATMGCGDECPLIRAKQREDWQIPDPKTLERDDFNKIRDQISEKVRSLLEVVYKRSFSNCDREGVSPDEKLSFNLTETGRFSVWLYGFFAL